MENGKTSEATATSTGLPQSVSSIGENYGETAQNYGQKISEAANQAKEFVSDKVSVVGDKIKDLQNVDVKELAANATDLCAKESGPGDSDLCGSRTSARAGAARRQTLNSGINLQRGFSSDGGNKQDYDNS